MNRMPVRPHIENNTVMGVRSNEAGFDVGSEGQEKNREELVHETHARSEIIKQLNNELEVAQKAIGENKAMHGIQGESSIKG